MHFERMRLMRSIATMAVGIVGSGLLLCPGCGGTSVETGSDIRAGYAWDTLRARLDYPIDEVYRAASDAVSQLGLEVLRHDHDGVAGEIYTLDAQRDTITIDVEAMPKGRTYLAIRTGVFGDRNKSEVIFERLLENLGQESSVARQ